MTQDKNFMLCSTVADAPEPPTPSDKAECMDCSEPIWIARAFHDSKVRPAMVGGQIVMVETPAVLEPVCTMCAIDRCYAEGDIDSAVRLTAMGRQLGYIHD